jgi:hypothetical protein
MDKVGNQRGRCPLQLNVVILAGTHGILLFTEGASGTGGGCGGAGTKACASQVGVIRRVHLTARCARLASSRPVWSASRSQQSQRSPDQHEDEDGIMAEEA